MRILLAEADPLLGDELQTGLRELGFLVDWVRHGDAAEHELRARPYAAAVLDLGLPLTDGTKILRAVRQARTATPVLALRARDAVPERTRRRGLGADDFVVKPLDLRELAARLLALVRRTHNRQSAPLLMRGVALDPASRSVTRDGASVTLTTCEFDLLHALMLNAGRALSRDQLEQPLCSWGKKIDSNAVEVHVHHLRRKLGAELIQTVRGVGYLIRESRT